MLMWWLFMLVSLLIAFGAVAFITLLERKYLGLSQIRLGPNKVTFIGILQPIADGVKLLAKQFLKSGLSQTSLFLVSPGLLLVIFMVLWTLVIPWEGCISVTKFSSLLLFSLLGVSTYAVILTGWAVMSTFAKLGSLRGILQSLSYEVALILVFLTVMILYDSLTTKRVELMSWELVVPWIGIWLILSMMETNRAPFDLLEGESELISGFNIEMGSLIFVFLFLSEYGMIIVMAMLVSALTQDTTGWSAFLITSIILITRSCYPRVRYDVLMTLMWQSLLPLSLLLFFMFLS